MKHLTKIAFTLAATYGVAGSIAFAGGIPSYYDSSYADIVKAGEKEGSLLVYSNMGPENWEFVIKGFNKLYPNIKVETLDLGSSEVFDRYLAEKATGSRTADFMATGSINGWLDFADKGEIVNYKAQEIGKVPAWSIPMPGLYTVSTDPMVLVYNKMLVPENLRADTFAGFAKNVAENPKIFKGKVGTYTAEGSFGLAINWSFVREKGDKAWKMLGQIGDNAKPGGGSGSMMAKLTSGEYAAAYFISGIGVFPRMDENRKKLLTWTYFKDGTPVFMRGMAIPKGSKNKNAAKLMLNYIMSHDGQVAFGKGGMTPYRDSVKIGDVSNATLGNIKSTVGEKNIVYINYDKNLMTGADALIDKWRKTLKVKKKK